LRKNPFEDFDDEFKTQFRLAKTRPTVKKLLEDIGELACRLHKSIDFITKIVLLYLIVKHALAMT